MGIPQDMRQKARCSVSSSAVRSSRLKSISINGNVGSATASVDKARSTGVLPGSLPVT